MLKPIMPHWVPSENEQLEPLLTFSGRINRSRMAGDMLKACGLLAASVALVVTPAHSALDLLAPTFAPAIALAMLAATIGLWLWIVIAASVKRSHDAGFSGWAAALSVPLLMRSEARPNRHGDIPR